MMYGSTKLTNRLEIEKLLKNLNNQINFVSVEQQYFKQREERFRETTDSTFERVWIICMIQLIALITSSKLNVWITY